MATLTVTEIVADLIGAFRQKNLPLSFFASDFGDKEAVKGQQIIAHVAQMPVASTYDATQGGYANGAQNATGLLVDVPVTMDQHITVPIKIAHTDAISTRSTKYLKTIDNAAYVLGKAMIDYALGTVTPANFSQTTAQAIVDTNRDTLSTVTAAMNAKDTSAPTRNGLVSSAVFNALDSDTRITSNQFHGERREGDTLGRIRNVAGFAELVEWPTLQGTNNLSAFFFDEARDCHRHAPAQQHGRHRRFPGHPGGREDRGGQGPRERPLHHGLRVDRARDHGHLHHVHRAFRRDLRQAQRRQRQHLRLRRLSPHHGLKPSDPTLRRAAPVRDDVPRRPSARPAKFPFFHDPHQMSTEIRDTAAGYKIGTSENQPVSFHGAEPVPQRASVAQAVAVDLPTALVLVNELRAALIEKGLIKGSA